MSKFKNSTARTLYLVAHTNVRRSPCVWLVEDYLRLPSAGSSSRSVLMMINDWADLCVVSLQPATSRHSRRGSNNHNHSPTADFNRGLTAVDSYRVNLFEDVNGLID